MKIIHDLDEKEKKMKNNILSFLKFVWLFRYILFENTYCLSFVWADPAGGEIGASVNSWQKNTPGSALSYHNISNQNIKNIKL